ALPRHDHRRGALDDRCQGRPLRDGRGVVERPLPAVAGDDGCRQGAHRFPKARGIGRAELWPKTFTRTTILPVSTGQWLAASTPVMSRCGRAPITEAATSPITAGLDTEREADQ